MGRNLKRSWEQERAGDEENMRKEGEGLSGEEGFW